MVIADCVVINLHIFYIIYQDNLIKVVLNIYIFFKEGKCMRKILVPLLALMLICLSINAFADGNGTVNLDLNKDKLQIYSSSDPYVNGLLSQENFLETNGIKEVLVIPVKKSAKIKVTVTPKNVKNKKVSLSISNEAVAKVKGDSITGLTPGDTVLTITSEEDPSVHIKYRVLVIQPVSRITLSASANSVNVGESVNITADYKPDNASVKKVVWKSADERIATITEDGIVTGVKRGNARFTATADDGSKSRASISIKVTQKAENITINKEEATVDVGKSIVLKATVLPKDTDNKKVEWSSSDTSVATVNNQGRITGVSTGSCEITCTSLSDGAVQSKAKINVQQPVKSVKFDEAPVIYVNESGKLSWKVEPANATNPAISLKSANEKILKVEADGTITGVKAGETYVNAVTTDGSNRRAKIKVVVYQHIKSVRMKRDTAYIDVKETDVVSALLDPDKYVNKNVFWEISDTSVASIKQDKVKNKVRITGVKEGSAVITGTTEDGGLKTSMNVRIGNWSKMLKIKDAYIDGKGRLHISVKNNSEELPVTSITLEIEAYTSYGDPVAINTKDGSNIVELTYSKRLNAGKSTPEDQWKFKDYNPDIGFHWMIVRVTKFQIDNDWVKVLRKNYQPTFEYKPRNY